MVASSTGLYLSGNREINMMMVIISAKAAAILANVITIINDI